ncbi:MAG: sulfite exporter TauE/SafE family protein [Alphaproteobacteria bacterium]|nr:sulfite exporter TauE/SafE family protein [Alphaproteobacteria bacterium]
MHVYLPIAEISVNVFLLLGMGAGVGVLSGLFGVGGGFLMTPLLIFIGVPPAVAVGSEANQLVATSITGVLAHWRRKSVDFKMGSVLLVGGVIGSTGGVFLFKALQKLGQIDLVISLCYVVFLGIIGLLMFSESMRSMLKQKRGGARRGKLHKHTWVHGLPFKMRFHKSRLYVSALLPLFVGVLVGVLAAIMGVGGGFIMVPAMIYLIGMPTSVVAGTSLFQILFVVANVTFLQAWQNQTVDILLALLLLVGSVLGVQVGIRLGAKLPSEQFRVLLAVLVLLTCGKLAFDLIATPGNPFSLALGGGH